MTKFSILLLVLLLFGCNLLQTEHPVPTISTELVVQTAVPATSLPTLTPELASTPVVPQASPTLPPETYSLPLDPPDVTYRMVQGITQEDADSWNTPPLSVGFMVIDIWQHDKEGGSIQVSNGSVIRNRTGLPLPIEINNFQLMPTAWIPDIDLYSSDEWNKLDEVEKSRYLMVLEYHNVFSTAPSEHEESPMVAIVSDDYRVLNTLFILICLAGSELDGDWSAGFEPMSIALNKSAISAEVWTSAFFRESYEAYLIVAGEVPTVSEGVYYGAPRFLEDQTGLRGLPFAIVDYIPQYEIIVPLIGPPIPPGDSA